MITIYKDDGKREQVEASLIEIASTDGLPALFILKDGNGRIEILRPENPKFARICQGLNKKPAKTFDVIL